MLPLCGQGAQGGPFVLHGWWTSVQWLLAPSPLPEGVRGGVVDIAPGAGDKARGGTPQPVRLNPALGAVTDCSSQAALQNVRGLNRLCVW